MVTKHKIRYPLPILALLLLLTSIVSAQSSAVYNLDDSGSAKMSVSEPINLDMSDISVKASLGKNNVFTFTGYFVSPDVAQQLDYRMSLNAEGTSSNTAFDITGQQVTDILADTGDFQATVSVNESSETLDIGISAHVTKAFVEDSLLLDTASLKAGPDAFAQDIEDTLNEALASPLMPSELQASVSHFSISGDSDMTISMGVSISGWGPFMAAVAASDYQNASDSTKLLECLGVDSQSLLTQLFSRRSTNRLEITGSVDGDRISGTLSSNSDQSPIAESHIEKLSVTLSKNGVRTSVDGSAGITDSEGLATCLMSNYVPHGSVQTLDYAISSSGGKSVQTISGSIDSLATQSGDAMTVTFPKETTDAFNVTVKVPSDMSISSVSGGNSQGRSAFSTGGDFSVSYAKEAPAIDNNLLIVIALVVILLLILLSRRKKK